MGLFDKLKGKNQVKKENVNPNSFWEIEDVNDFIIAAYDYVCQISLYGIDL